jgi:formamidopyrimidine-DNA glycosylase
VPELPEVETMRRGVAGVAGARIERVEFVRGRAKPIAVKPSRAVFRRRLEGRTIAEVGRIGKRVVLHLDDGHAVIIEPRMTGLVLVADPPNVDHLRLRLQLSGTKRGNPQELLFWDRRGLGVVHVLSPKQLAALRDAKLGPDALSISPDDLRDRLAPRKRPIKVALLDQAIVAGIGNLYASEILHLCGIHPERSCVSLKNDEWPRLHAAMLEVLELAIRYEGSTLSDGTYRNALNKEGGYQNEHRVYDKAGETCPTCGESEVIRIMQAQRSTFFCDVCQRPRRSRK